MISVFFSYSHADEALRDQLQTQLAILQRQSVIETWHDRRIGAGEEWARSIDQHLENDDIILLLVSPDFLNSDYCYDVEMARAIERHEAGDAVVIPVILRACPWKDAPFGKLQAVPTDGRPVTMMPDRDSAFLEVAEAVKAAAGRIAAKAPRGIPTEPSVSVPDTADGAPVVRSSNLGITKVFNERDKDNFRLEAFDYIARFFESSLAELQARNADVESSFRRIDANRFTAAVYRDGKARARCTVFLGGAHTFSTGIGFVEGETTGSNSYNELLSVSSDDQSMFLRSLGMTSYGSNGEAQKLTLEGAAELYWGRFIEPLQRK